jgi:hypothetical protein
MSNTEIAEPVETELPSLSDWREKLTAATNDTVEPPPTTPTEPPTAETAITEPSDVPKESVAEPPETDKHRWKDPETGLRLDLRRRDHRKIKGALEERASMAQQIRKFESRAPQPQEPPPPVQPTTQSDAEPTLEQFADQPDPYGAHIQAMARWVSRQEYQKQHAETSRVEVASRREAQAHSLQRSWDGRLETVRKRYPDFDQAQAALYEALPKDGRAQPLVYRLMTTKAGQDVAYYLGTHPSEVQRLFGLSPHDHLLALGAIEAQVRATNHKTSPTPVSISPPEPPITPVGASATQTTFNGDTASLAQWRAHHKIRGGRSVA